MDQIQLNGKTQELVDEIVRLSQQYGIMTPYTSFLADERTALSRRSEVREKAGVAMDRLARGTTGGLGQRNAAMRKDMAQAESLAPATPVAAEPGGRARRAGLRLRQHQRRGV